MFVVNLKIPKIKILINLLFKDKRGISMLGETPRVISILYESIILYMNLTLLEER